MTDRTATTDTAFASAVTLLRRGQIVLAELDPVRGSEQNKTRPVLVISNNARNDVISRSGRGVLTVLPISSKVDSVYPFQVLLTTDESGLPKDSKVQCEQIRALDFSRVVRPVGWVTAETLARVEAALVLHLAL